MFFYKMSTPALGAHTFSYLIRTGVHSRGSSGWGVKLTTNLYLVKVNGKGKGHPRTGHEDPEGVEVFLL
jgi:hypothetical protein